MKEELITLLNSYAAARCSGDTLLQQFATGQLQAFLEQVELTKTTPAAEDTANG